jgi:hypothetical protein
MQSVSRWVVRKLKLAVNEAKSSVSCPWKVRYLGFRITRIFGATRNYCSETAEPLIT